MSAIMISQIKVTNADAFRNYLRKTREVAARYQAELLFRGRMAGALNGAPHAHEMVVIAKFPDIETIRAWHASPEYQALIPLREEGSEQLMVTYEEAA